jgi:hypothetical protein
MTYPYRILSLGLRETADAAIEWFIREWGLKKGRIQVEASFHRDIDYRPTFVVQLDDGHLLCVDVSQSIYSNTLDSVALACLQEGLPVRFFVAVPRDIKDPDYSVNIKKAKRAGVGLLEVDSHSGTIIQSALSLSLAGVRSLELTEFPARYRHDLQHAQQVFRDGDPSKACSHVYDELEAACRRFAKKCVARKLWKNPNNLKLDSDPWANILADLDRTLDRNSNLTRRVTPALIARLIGVTTHRNESGHKPKNVKELTKRDQALRTRFEGAVDLLKEFLDATSKFRI